MSNEEITDLMLEFWLEYKNPLAMFISWLVSEQAIEDFYE